MRQKILDGKVQSSTFSSNHKFSALRKSIVESVVETSKTAQLATRKGQVECCAEQCKDMRERAIKTRTNSVHLTRQFRIDIVFPSCFNRKCFPSLSFSSSYTKRIHFIWNFHLALAFLNSNHTNSSHVQTLIKISWPKKKRTSNKNRHQRKNFHN